MIGVLIITHEDLGDQLIRCASHVLGVQPSQLAYLSVFPQDDPEATLAKARTFIAQLDSGDGILLLSDILGATPCNIASRLVQPGKVACIAGVNLPMLVRVLTYRNEPLSAVVEKAISGGLRGVLAIDTELDHAS